MSMAIEDDLYRNAPVEQVERLQVFRATHPYRHLQVGGVEWEYIASGGHMAGLSRRDEFDAVVDQFLGK